MKVYFVGAGPGDPKLITIKGKECIEIADIIIYAGSLVNEEILKYNSKAREVHNSATMDLNQMGEVFRKAKEEGLIVTRIHSGDPSIYGAINEQINLLDKMSISYEVVPGVSSFQAAAAALCQELTMPEVCQTITLTRISGRTPVPDKERLEEIIKTRPTLILFLSISKLEEIVGILKKGYDPSTPVAIVYKVSWPEEKIFKGTVENILEKFQERDITMSALIMVGEALAKKGANSLLYDENFSHMCREV